jgi:nitric oxide reductase large subunit
MTIVFMILVLISVIALAFWVSGEREDHERAARRRELREAREKAVREREARVTRGVNR